MGQKESCRPSVSIYSLAFFRYRVHLDFLLCVHLYRWLAVPFSGLLF